MPGTPEWLDVSVIPGLIALEHRDQVVWLYPSSLLNRRPPSQALPAGARAASDLPRQPESGSAHCFVTVRPLLAWPYHQRINERCRILRRKSLCPAPSPRRAGRQRATIAILVEENAYWLDANRRSFGFIPEDSKGGWLRWKDRLRSRRLAANVKCSAQPAQSLLAAASGGRMEPQGASDIDGLSREAEMSGASE